MYNYLTLALKEISTVNLPHFPELNAKREIKRQWSVTSRSLSRLRVKELRRTMFSCVYNLKQHGGMSRANEETVRARSPLSSMVRLQMSPWSLLFFNLNLIFAPPNAVACSLFNYRSYEFDRLVRSSCSTFFIVSTRFVSNRLKYVLFIIYINKMSIIPLYCRYPYLYHRH